MKHYKVIILYMITALLFLSAPLPAHKQYINYTVQKGDTLTKIAKHFSIFISEIIAVNSIENPDIIRVGAGLNIPLESSVYMIKKGDTLEQIARKFNKDIETLIILNNIADPDKIYAGHYIYISEVENTYRNRKLAISRKNSLDFIWPVIGKISSPYGWRQHPVRGKKEFHNGIDIAVPLGSPVYAAEDGVVIFSGEAHGYGMLIIIQHRDNKRSYYAHNMRLIAKKGDKVKKGKIISLSGNSGISTGPHLHFEIRDNTRSEDPMKYLNQNYLRNGFKV